MKILLTSLTLFFIFFSLGCGYKPSSIYAKEALGERVFADIKIDLKEPENTILIKDAINEAIISRFKGKISDSANATSKIFVKLKDVDFEPIQYDKDGYIARYRTVVTLQIDYILKNSKKDKLLFDGYYDFLMEPDSIISDTKRFEAIKNASIKAIDKFISKVSILGYSNF